MTKLPVSTEPGPGVLPETPAAGGVPQGTPATEPKGDGGVTKVQTPEELQAQLKQAQEVAEKYRKDMDRMRSSLQQGEHVRAQAYEQRIADMDAQLKAALTADMDEVERIKFENEELRRNYANLQNQTAQDRARQAEYTAKLAWAQEFQKVGVDVSQLDINAPFNQFFGAGWSALIEKVGTPAAEAMLKKPAATPPPVVSGISGQPSTGPSWKELREMTGKDSEEEIYKMVEKGYLDPKLIPGQPFDE